MFTYECFYRNKRITVKALRSFDAQEQAAKILRVKKRWEIVVMLAADQTGMPITHSTAGIG